MTTLLKTSKGTRICRWHGSVGKHIRNYVYAHRNYHSEIVPNDVWERAILCAETEGFEFRCFRYNTKTREIVLHEAPDFDTAREPIPGSTLRITDDLIRLGYCDQIWHHKWLWVKDDYDGFDVAESWNWSKKYLAVLHDDGTKVANRGIANGSGHGDALWKEQLKHFGLE